MAWGITHHLPLSAGYILAGMLNCAIHDPPSVDIDFQDNQPEIINTHSTEYMSFIKADINTYDGEFNVVGGLTDPKFEFRTNVEFTSTSRADLDEACIWAKKVDLTVEFTPTVYIASNYHPGSCRYTMTWDHEMRHVKTALDTFREFQPYLKQTLEQAVTSLNVTGPIPKSELKAAQKNISEQISAALKKSTDSMHEILITRQQMIDSREEYNHQSVGCPNEPAR